MASSETNERASEKRRERNQPVEIHTLAALKICAFGIFSKARQSKLQIYIRIEAENRLCFYVSDHSPYNQQ